MTVAAFIHSLNERARPAPNWASPRGLYADLSRYPDIQYYTKCPKCGHVHGSYKTMRDAHSKRLCTKCDRETIEKMRKRVKEVDSYKNRGKPVKGLSHVFNEADELLPPAPPVPDPEEGDEEIPFNALDYLLSTTKYDGWLDPALKSLSERTGYDGFQLKDTHRRELDTEDPDSIEEFIAVAEGFEYGQVTEVSFHVFRDLDVAQAEAKRRVVNDLEQEPEIFDQDFLIRHINTDRIRNDLRSDLINMDRERYHDEYPEPENKRDWLIDAGALDVADFFDDEGNELHITPEKENEIDRAFYAQIETEADKQLEDPVQYLKDMNGEKDGIKEAIRIGGINIEAAAQAAINADGWVHYMSSYDGNEIDLDGDAVAIRIG